MIPLKIKQTHVENTLLGVNTMISNVRNYDASIVSSSTITFDNDRIRMLRERFKYNFGELSDGTMYRHPGDEQFGIITSDIIIYQKKRDVGSGVMNVRTRSNEERTSIDLYIGGKKIPDAELFTYASKSSTDILFPLKYIDLNSNSITIHIELREYNRFGNQYLNGYMNVDGQSMITFNFQQFIITANAPNKNNVLVFINGILQSLPSYNATFNSTNIILSFSKNISGVIEIFCDNTIRYRGEGVVGNSLSGKAGFGIPSSYIDPIHGPVSKKALSFFIAGKRIGNSLVEQVGLLNFSTPTLTASINDVTTIILTDRNYIDDRSTVYYGEDYFLYNFIGNEGVNKAIEGSPVNPYLDGFVDYLKILNDDGERFNDGLIYNVRQTLSKLDPENQLIYILSKFKSSIRSFLLQYKRNSKIFIIDYNGTDSEVIISSSEEGVDVSYDVLVNGVHIPMMQLRVFERGDTKMIGIPSTALRTGANIVELNIMDVAGATAQFITIQPDQIKPVVYPGIGTFYQYELPILQNVSTSDDVLVIQQVKTIGDLAELRGKTIDELQIEEMDFPYDNEDGGDYLEVGYAVDRRVNIEVLSAGIIRLNYSTPITKPIVLVNRKFRMCLSTKLTARPSDLKLTDLFIPIVFGPREDPLPLIPNSRMRVYVGDKILMEGFDYYYRTPNDFDRLTYSGIVLTTNFPVGTPIDIYFTGYENKTIWKIDHAVANKYGLLYLKQLEFPFHNKYINVYMGGRKLIGGDIDILSDKLIRVHSKKLPFKDIFIETAFVEDYSRLKPFFSLYSPSDFELRLENLFQMADYVTPQLLGEQIPNGTLAYESFIQTVDSVLRAPNPVDPSYDIPPTPTDPTIPASYDQNLDYDIPDRADLYLYAYLRWIMYSGEHKAIFSAGSPIPEPIMRKFEIFIGDIAEGSRDLVIRGATANLLREMPSGEQKWLKDLKSRLNYIAQWIFNNSTSMRDAYELYKSSSYANVLYEWDIPPLRGNVRIEKPYDVIIGARERSTFDATPLGSLSIYNTDKGIFTKELDGSYTWTERSEGLHFKYGEIDIKTNRYSDNGGVNYFVIHTNFGSFYTKDDIKFYPYNETTDIRTRLSIY